MSDALKIIMILGFSIFCFLTFSRKLYKVLDDKNDYTLMQRFYAMNTVAIILALIVHCVAVSPILRMLAIRSEVVRVISIVVFYCIYKARIAAQLAMSMSEIFANSYRNQKDHKEFFTYLKNNNKIIIYGGKNGLNGLGIKQSIMGKDYRKYINNAILFPTFKLSKKDPREKLDEWTSMYILKALRNQS